MPGFRSFMSRDLVNPALALGIVDSESAQLSDMTAPAVFTSELLHVSEKTSSKFRPPVFSSQRPDDYDLTSRKARQFKRLTRKKLRAEWRLAQTGVLATSRYHHTQPMANSLVGSSTQPAASSLDVNAIKLTNPLVSERYCAEPGLSQSEMSTQNATYGLPAWLNKQYCCTKKSIGMNVKPYKATFNTLPPELRIQIWTHVCMQPRLIKIKQKYINHRDDAGALIDARRAPDFDDNVWHAQVIAYCAKIHEGICSKTKNPPILSINREARYEALKFYDPLNPGRMNHVERIIYINPSIDYVYFSPMRQKQDLNLGTIYRESIWSALDTNIMQNILIDLHWVQNKPILGYAEPLRLEGTFANAFRGRLQGLKDVVLVPKVMHHHLDKAFRHCPIVKKMQVGGDERLTSDFLARLMFHDMAEKRRWEEMTRVVHRNSEDNRV